MHLPQKHSSIYTRQIYKLNVFRGFFLFYPIFKDFIFISFHILSYLVFFQIFKVFLSLFKYTKIILVIHNLELNQKRINEYKRNHKFITLSSHTLEKQTYQTINSIDNNYFSLFCYLIMKFLVYF